MLLSLNSISPLDTMTRTAQSAAQVIARNTLFLMGGQIALRLGSFLFNIFVIRQLGDATFGQYSVVLAWTGLFAVLGDLGVTQYFTREVARDPRRGDELFWDVAALRLILAVVASVVTIVGAVLRGYPTDIVIAVALFTTTYFFQAVLAPLTSVIAGNERLDIASVISVIGQVVFMLIGAVVLFSGGGLIALVAVSFLNLPLMIGLSVWAVRHYNMRPVRPVFQISQWWRLVRWGLPFALIQLTLTFNFRIDTIILEQFASFEVVGWYNAAYNFTRSLLTISSALIIALPLTLAREHARDPEVVRPWYYRSVKFMVFVGLPLAVGGMLLADRIVALLYGPDYAPAAVAVAILVWDTPLLMYTALCGNLTTAIKREHTAMRIYLAVGLFNVVMNLALQPLFGMIAASVITVGSETVGVLLFYILFRREFGAGLSFNHLFRLGVSAGLMGLLIIALRDLPLLLNVPISAGAYLILVVVTGALTVQERQMIAGVLARKLGRFLPQRAKS